MFDQASDGRSVNCYPAGGFAAADTAKSGKYDPHLTSGASNRFAYLLAEGAVAPAGVSCAASQLVCNGDTGIVGIGRAKLRAIWYRALTTYFVSSTDYPGARAGTLQAAADLYGAGSAEYQTVARVWSAVKVN
jgi:Zn-dependent metalloprotease